MGRRFESTVTLYLLVDLAMGLRFPRLRWPLRGIPAERRGCWLNIRPTSYYS